MMLARDAAQREVVVQMPLGEGPECVRDCEAGVQRGDVGREAAGEKTPAPDNCIDCSSLGWKKYAGGMSSCFTSFG